MLADRGVNVVVAARRADTGEPIAATIRSGGGTAICIPTDVTRRDEVDACVAATVERFGSLEIMVHNPFTGRGRTGSSSRDSTSTGAR